jgi:NADH:ubiquinone oxidoreductase subunit
MDLHLLLSQKYSDMKYTLVVNEYNSIERDRRLQAVDWVVIRATSTTTPVPEAWATYMQALRDLPATTEDPENPVWPPVPA